MTTRSLLAAVALTMATVATGCADTSTPTGIAPAARASSSVTPDMAHMGATIGNTLGWSDGATVTFHYTKEFFCQQPPTSGATSQCELGANAEVPPRGGLIPILYVIVPLGFVPPAETVQCPAGNCVTHPTTIDLSRVFGAGSENATLPAHSHIIGDEGTPILANGGWWVIDVVGVTSLSSWNKIAAAKNLASVRQLQAAGDGITGDIPTNLYLFFSVK